MCTNGAGIGMELIPVLRNTIHMAGQPEPIALYGAGLGIHSFSAVAYFIAAKAVRIWFRKDWD